MKTKLLRAISTVALLFLGSAGPALAQNGTRTGAAAANFTPTQMASSPGAGAIDPTTGLPVETPWISPEWSDPTGGKPPATIVLTNVDFDSLPFSEVGRELQERYNEGFDILIPPDWTAPSGEKFDLNQWTVKIQLHNVTASQVFRAMNLSFEVQGFPMRWQLIMNEMRPTVLLRVLPDIMIRTTHPLSPYTGRPGPPPQAEQPHPVVIYVGDLLGDEKLGGMTLDQVFDTLQIVNKMAGNEDVNINLSPKAQLVVIKGTSDQIAFATSTLQALRQKVQSDRAAKILANSVEKPAASASGSK